MINLIDYVQKNLNKSVYLNCEHCGRERWFLFERTNKNRVVWVCEKCSDKYPNDGTIAKIPDYIHLD